MSRIHFLILLLLVAILTLPPNSTQSTTKINPYKFHLTFAPPPPRRPLTPKVQKEEMVQTPAEDRLLGIIPDGVISFPATYVPKPFGDGSKPLWVPHGYFNLCPFVRGSDIDPVWAQGCSQPPFGDFNNFNNMQDMVTRLQALQQQQLMTQVQAQQPQQPEPQQQTPEVPSWMQQYVPAGPIDFGMANMYGPIQAQEMHAKDEYARKQASRPCAGSSFFNWGSGSSASFWG